MDDEQKLVELKTAIAAYKATPKSADMVAQFDFGILLTILPMLLRLFIKDEALLGIIQKIVELLTGLFKNEATA